MSNNIYHLNRLQQASQAGYRWTNKDPMLEAVVIIMKESGLTYKQIADRSGVSISTLQNWDTGKTKRAFFCTMRAVLRACDLQFALVPAQTRTDRTVRARQVWNKSMING